MDSAHWSAAPRRRGAGEARAGRQALRGTIGIAAAAALGVATMAPALAAPEAPDGPTEHTDMGVTGADTMAHLQELSDISLAHADDGYRAMGTPGYEAASQYVEDTLEATGGYDVTRQMFEVDDQTFGDVELTVDGTAYEIEPLAYTEAADPPVEGATVTLPADDAYGDGTGGELGCSVDDFVDVAGTIVLVQRGECAFGEKTVNATEAGAAGVVIYNNEAGPLNGTLGERFEGSAPSVALLQADGERLRDALIAASESEPPVELSGDLTLETEFVTVETWNVMAETTAGDPDSVQMLGAHLDGVPEGSGANDNGSGSAALLAVAEALVAQPTEVDHKVRFGFWGAEEVGLVGSTHYVNSLSETELGQIQSYLNFDMIASENYVVGTLDSDGSDVPVPPGVNVPEGSAQLEAIFTDYFDGIEQPHVGTDFSGRSDYQAFIDNGIPASGLFSGADGIKTAEEVEMFGGTEGVQHDRNYHQVTDTIENLSEESVGIFTPAIAFAAHTVAFDLTDEPTEEPTDDPTGEPTNDPTGEPTDDPSDDPSGEPTDEPTDELGLTITPEEIAVSDFVDEDKGVELTVTGALPGDEVDFEVTPASGQNTEAAVLTGTADEDGVASTRVYGTNAGSASDYLGDYDVTVEGLESEAATAGAEQAGTEASAAVDLSGTFSVVADGGDDDGNGGDDDGNGGGDDGNGGGDGDGDDLPRTGSDLLPLVAGAGALLVGGAALVLTTRNRRRS
ncbi:M20/M25/M40 family metallo-hydrolase [Brevibacterium senegalense]|uniref:M20/M25/M40 family metallo-hydrolase n=1 Tax=Brevibacterium senegalense TaxID=1033736 RepID=UPI00036B0480|nr:M20/M25/M40 family metallo-hydrolase [Brevibacterium senegalense]